MAERVVSPGVFTQERDLTFLADGVVQIGAAFVGPTVRGPAFIPTTVQGINGFVTTFGDVDANSYTGFAAKNYLQEAGSATIVRTLGLDGYSTNVGYLLASGSAGTRVLAVIHPTGIGETITSFGVTGTTASFTLTVAATGSSLPTTSSNLTASPSDASYFAKILGTAPNNTGTSPAYVYASFPEALSQAGAGVTLTTTTASLSVIREYNNASTPWIQSQEATPASRKNLFKFHTLSDGVAANTDVKVSIIGINPSGSGAPASFTVLVRAFDDTDNSTNVLEQFDNVNLDPTSANYIARRIGNSEPISGSYEGDFPNRSNFIRVELNDEISISLSDVPYGFAALSSVFSSSAAQVPTASYVTSRWIDSGTPGWTSTAVDRRYYYGFDFASETAKSYLKAIPTTGSQTVGSAFNIIDLNPEVPTTTASESISLSNPLHVSYRRFSVPFQGGFDGLSPARVISMGANISPSNSQGFDLTNSLSAGSRAYSRALNLLNDPNSIDINLLVMPGIIYSQHEYIAEAAIQVCESRGDCFLVLDPDTLNASVSSTVTAIADLDTNYAAVYYPWVRVSNPSNGQLMWAPPSVVIPEVYAYNDAVGAPWFAPAGLNRGGIPGAVGVKTKLRQADIDILYEGRVNPIAKFPQQGISVWGQKTLQKRDSALDRINVRRLLIDAKRFISNAARVLVFEQNVEATRNRFLNQVNPYLAGIQQRSGLFAFQVVMDETNNTADIIDRNILVGAIYLQPTRTAEAIKLEFNILPTGATFDTV